MAVPSRTQSEGLAAAREGIMGLIFLYQEGGQWWLRRQAQGDVVRVEPAGIPADRPASEAHGLVQSRSFHDKVVVESSHDALADAPDRQEFAG